jgi:hypothetical protein
MRRTLIALAALAAITLPLVTHADLEGWHMIAQATDQPPTRIYLAPASLRAQPDGYIEAWFMADYGTLQADKSGSWRSRQFLMLIDCEKQNFAETGTQRYYRGNLGEGTVDRFSDHPGNRMPTWQRVVPNSIGDSELDSACDIWEEQHGPLTAETQYGY